MANLICSLSLLEKFSVDEEESILVLAFEHNCICCAEPLLQPYFNWEMLIAPQKICWRTSSWDFEFRASCLLCRSTKTRSGAN